MEKLWTTAEVATYLHVSEVDIERLVQEGKLTGYKLGGKFLRFRPDQVKALQGQVKPLDQDVDASSPPRESWRSRLSEFVYFYDFYLLSFTLLGGVLVYLIWSG